MTSKEAQWYATQAKGRSREIAKKGQRKYENSLVEVSFSMVKYQSDLTILHVRFLSWWRIKRVLVFLLENDMQVTRDWWSGRYIHAFTATVMPGGLCSTIRYNFMSTYPPSKSPAWTGKLKGSPASSQCPISFQECKAEIFGGLHILSEGC